MLKFDALLKATNGLLGSSEINDAQQSSTTTYSSNMIQNLLTACAAESQYPHVINYASLPAAATQTGAYWIVDNTTGVFLINQKKSGFWKSDGTNWNYIGTSVETTSLSDGANTVIGAPVTLLGNNGVSVSANPGTNIVTISGNTSIAMAMSIVLGG